MRKFCRTFRIVCRILAKIITFMKYFVVCFAIFAILIIAIPTYLQHKIRGRVVEMGFPRLESLGVYNARISNEKHCKTHTYDYEYEVPFSGITYDSVEVFGCLCYDGENVFVYSIIDKKDAKKR